MKHTVANNMETYDSEVEESSLLNFDSLISDEVIGISDVPIFKINKIEIGVDPKPIGSAYILINMSVIEAPELKVNARVCVDTGADMTICSHVFIIKKFGEKTLQPHLARKKLNCHLLLFVDQV